MTTGRVAEARNKINTAIVIIDEAVGLLRDGREVKIADDVEKIKEQLRSMRDEIKDRLESFPSDHRGS